MAWIIQFLCKVIDFGQKVQFEGFCTTYIDTPWKITNRLIDRQTKNICQIFNFQKFPTIIDVYGWWYEKKIIFLKIEKIKFFIFPLNLDFWGK